MSFLNIGPKVMGKDQELLDAARTGNSAAIERLLSNKIGRRSVGGAFSSLTSFLKSANVNCTDKNGYTPLHHAAVNGHRDAVEVLLKAEAQPSILDSQGCSPLHLAAWSGNPEICEQLLTTAHTTLHVNQQNGSGETALHSAAQYGHVAVVDVLLQKKANPTIRSLKEETPVDLAAQYGRLEVVQLLLIQHPDLIELPVYNNSPLHLASRNGHLDIVAVLLEKGFSLNARTQDGTALHEAAVHGKLDVVRMLLACGIDASLQNEAGRTALDMVKEVRSEQGFSEITKAISEYVERTNPPEVVGGGGGSPAGSHRPTPAPRRSLGSPPCSPGLPSHDAHSSMYAKPIKEARTASPDSRAVSTTSSIGEPPPLPPRSSIFPVSTDQSSPGQGERSATPPTPPVRSGTPEQSPTVPRSRAPPRPDPTASPPDTSHSSPPAVHVERSQPGESTNAEGSSDVPFTSSTYMAMDGVQKEQPIAANRPSLIKPKKPPRQKKSPVPTRRSPPVAAQQSPPDSPPHFHAPEPPKPSPQPSPNPPKDVSIPVSSSSPIVSQQTSVTPSPEFSPTSLLPPPPPCAMGPDTYLTPDSSAHPPPDPSPKSQQQVYMEMAEVPKAKLPIKDTPVDNYGMLFPKFKTSPKHKRPEFKRTNTAPEENVYVEPTSPVSRFKERHKLLKRSNTSPEENVYMSIADKPGTPSGGEAIYSQIADLPPPVPPKKEGAVERGSRRDASEGIQGSPANPPNSQLMAAENFSSAESHTVDVKSMEKPSSLNVVEKSKPPDKPDNPLTPTGYPQPPTPDFPPPSPATALLGIEQKMQQMDVKRKSRDITTLTDENFPESLRSIDEQDQASEPTSPTMSAPAIPPKPRIPARKPVPPIPASNTQKTDTKQQICDEPKPVKHTPQDVKTASDQSDSNKPFQSYIPTTVGGTKETQPSVIDSETSRNIPVSSIPKQTVIEKQDSQSVPKDQSETRSEFHSSPTVSREVDQSNIQSLDQSGVRTGKDSDSKSGDQSVAPAPSGTSREQVSEERGDSQVVLGQEAAAADTVTDSSVVAEEDFGPEHVVMRRKKSSTSTPEVEMGMFEGLLRGSIIGGPRNVTSQIRESIALWQTKGGNRTSVPSQFLTFDPVMEKEDEIDIDMVMQSIDQEVEKRASSSGRPSTITKDQPSFDDSAEWEKIEDVMKSIGAGITRESCFVRDLEPAFLKLLAGDSQIQSVGEWLEALGLQQYENAFIANGFDNLDFLGNNVMEEQDLEQIGVMNYDHRQQILSAAKSLPHLQPIDPSTPPASVFSWLSSLQLLDHLETFRSHGYDTMEKVQSILWELQLRTVLDISALGHRKRILASLGERHPPERQNGSLKKRLGSHSPEEVKSPFVDVDLFKDYTNVKPLHSSEEDIKTSPPPVVSSEEEDVFKREGSKQIKNSNLHLRPPNVAQTKSPVRKWRHNPEMLIKGCCNYTAQYLGSTIVKELSGTESTRAGISKLKKSADVLAKIPIIMLSISFKGVKFIDAKSKRVICDHEIGNIFCACQDTENLNFFAYITRDIETAQHYCHVFSVKSPSLAHDIILTLGESFEVAYQMALKDKSMAEALELDRKTSVSDPEDSYSVTSKNSTNTV